VNFYERTPAENPAASQGLQTQLSQASAREDVVRRERDRLGERTKELERDLSDTKAALNKATENLKNANAQIALLQAKSVGLARGSVDPPPKPQNPTAEQSTKPEDRTIVDAPNPSEAGQVLSRRFHLRVDSVSTSRGGRGDL
jgi:hypothetical protein